MVPLITLLAVGRALDGQDAVEAARKFLQRMNAPKVAGLAGLSEQDGKGWGQKGQVWRVGFELAEGGAFSVLMDTKGTVFYASGAGKKGPNLDEVTARKDAEALMSKVPDAVPVRFQAISRGEEEGASARFDAVFDGKRFFNQNPAYGYFLSFDRKGRLTWFGRTDRLPVVSTHRVKISRSAAVEILTKVWNDSKPGPWPDPRYVEAELGFFLVKGEPTARLVWHGEVFTGPRSQQRQFTTLSTFADATTGELIKGDSQ